MRLDHGILAVILVAVGVHIGHWSRDREVQRGKDALTTAQVMQCTKADRLLRLLPKDS